MASELPTMLPTMTVEAEPPRLARHRQPFGETRRTYRA